MWWKTWVQRFEPKYKRQNTDCKYTSSRVTKTTEPKRQRENYDAVDRAKGSDFVILKISVGSKHLLHAYLWSKDGSDWGIILDFCAKASLAFMITLVNHLISSCSINHFSSVVASDFHFLCLLKAASRGTQFNDNGEVNENFIKICSDTNVKM